jgi:formylglycine-generating enzyme required for sulfatase activity
VQTARRLLAGFEKEWGNTAAGKPWAAVVREALFYPWAGDAPLAIPDLGMELVPVPAGSFLMGSSAGDPGEQPVHSVQITRAFWLGKHEVTQGQYEKLAGTNPCQVPDALNPVDSVSWHQATAFCAQLSEEERRAGRVPDGYAYRLPSEAEWEYAVRGGPVAKGHGYAGSDNANEVGWYGENSGGRTHRVGQKRPNELGLCDMIGNVCEWCLDYYEKTYYSRSPGADPANMQVSALRVFRGGSMVEPATGIGPGVRGKLGPHDTTAYIGFRVCLGPVITE